MYKKAIINAILFSLLLAISSILLISAPVRAEQDPFAVMKQEKIGQLKEGMPAARIFELLGKPGKKTAAQFEHATGLYKSQWDYPKKGVVLWMASEKKDGAMKVDAIKITAPCKFKTSKGMGIGSTYEAVKKAYQKTLMDKDHCSERQLIYGSIYGGIFFTFKNGKVTEIFLGAGAE